MQLQRLNKKQKKQDVGGDKESKKSRPVHKKKHVKLAEKKKKLAQKFEMMLKEQQDEKKQKKVDRANRKIGSVANMGAIKDALPSLDSLLKFKASGDIKSGLPEYDAIKLKKGQSAKVAKGKEKKINKFAKKEQRISKETKEINSRCDYLKKLMNDKGFRSNPRKVIAEHIKNTLEMEEKK